MKKVLTIILAAALTISMMTGCGESPKENTENTAAETVTEEKEEATEETTEPAQEEGIVLAYPENMQEKGFTETLTLEQMPERVVVMSKAPVLALHEMGIKMIAIPKGGSTEWPEDLDAETEKLDVSMNSNFDIETVVALNPDLVIMGASSQEKYGQVLTDAGIPIYYVDSGHTVPYESVKAQTKALTDGFGKGSEESKNIMARFDELEQKLDSIKDKYADKKVMVLQSAPPAHYIQTEAGTLASMAKMMGFQNVYHNDAAPMAQLDLETAIDYDPDLVLCVGGTSKPEEHQKAMEEDFAKNPEYWNSIPAIKEGNILYFSGDFIANTGIGFLNSMNEMIERVEAFYQE